MIKKKLRSKGGFTLTELLITVAIVALIGVAVAAGITAAGRAYGSGIASSEASVLSGTLAIELADELRFAENISVSGETFTFTSRRFGPGVSVEDDGNGRVTVGGSQILADKAYTGLNAAADVTYDGAYFEVTITVSSAGGSTLRQSSFSIAPVSG